jgi:predicted dehydrogenase
MTEHSVMSNVPRGFGVGMVGQGFIGRAHASALQRLRALEPTRLRLVALCGRDVERARRNAAAWGFDRAEGDWRAVVEADDIDVVCVCATNDLHREVSLAAMAAGKTVVCEKPLGRALEESAAMLRHARTSGLVHMCSFNYRYVPAVQLARRLLDSGEIGAVVRFRAQYLQDWGWTAPHDWHFERRFAGPGVIGDYCHIVDLAHHLVGDVARVSAETLTVAATRPDRAGIVRPVDVEDAYVASGRFASGALLSLEASRVATGRKAQHVFEVSGELGALWWDMEDLNHLWFFRRDDGATAGFRKILVTEPEHPFMGRWWPTGHTIGWEEALVHQWSAVGAALADGRVHDPQATFEDGWRADAVTHALVSAAASGSAVDVDYGLESVSVPEPPSRR